MALARLFTVSLALFSASSVLITSWCSALISTPMYCAAWLRADSTALALPSSSEGAPSFAPEKYRASGDDGAFASQAGGLGEELVFTAGFSPPQASASAVRARSLLRKADLGRRVLLRQLPRVGLQPVDVVALRAHLPLVGERIGLVHHRLGLFVVARVLVGKAQVPVTLRDLAGLQLHVLLRRLDRVVERALRVLPVPALRPADAALELGYVGVLLEVRVLVFLVRNDRLHEPLDHGAARAVFQRDAIDRFWAAIQRAVGIVAPLLVGLGDDQPAGRHVHHLERRADVRFALERVPGVPDLLVILVARLVGLLAVAALHVPEDQGARSHHLAELGRRPRVRQIGGGELEL